MQTAVGIEDVVLGIVNGEGLTGIGRTFGRARRAQFESGVRAQVEGLQDDLQLFAIGGEVLVDGDGISQRHNRNQIGWLHLLVEVILCGVGRAFDLVGLHRRQVEEQDDQPAIFDRRLLRIGSGSAGRDRLHLFRWRAQQIRLLHRDLLHVFRVLDVEGRYLLRLVVFQHGEVFRFQVAHRITILVAHGDVHQHQFGLRFEGVAASLLRR